MRLNGINQTLKEILGVSENKKIDIVNFNVIKPNLEDVFLSTTKKDLVE